MIRENVLKVRERIRAACSRAGRDPQSVILVAVGKGRDACQVKEVIEAGVADIGENKVQEALVKFPGLPHAERHMVGHLQTNKAKDAVRLFDLIHSVDSMRLAEEINKQAAKAGKVQEILVEVKTSPEEAKYGVSPEETVSLLKDIATLQNVAVRGLMTIASVADNPEAARPYFKRLKELRDKIYELRVTSYELRILSMGMTDDFETAIEEGATMVRIGRAIFET